jgi:hypothetical protein
MTDVQKQVGSNERHFMKTTLGILSLAGLALVAAHGQSTEAVATATNQTRPADVLHLDPELTQQQFETMFRFQTDMVSRVFGINATFDGVIPRALRAEQPLQLINPLAPPEYGIGAEILSINPLTHRVEGISFFTFRF